MARGSQAWPANKLSGDPNGLGLLAGGGLDFPDTNYLPNELCDRLSSAASAENSASNWSYLGQLAPSYSERAPIPGGRLPVAPAGPIGIRRNRRSSKRPILLAWPLGFLNTRTCTTHTTLASADPLVHAVLDYRIWKTLGTGNSCRRALDCGRAVGPPGISTFIRGDEALDAWFVENLTKAIMIGEQVADWST